MEKVVLKADIRKDFSKSVRNTSRKNGIVPGVFYFRNIEPFSVEVQEKLLKPLVYTSQTHLIALQVDGQEEYECIIKDVQFDPLTDKVVHFDLYGLIKGEKIELEVPLQFKGAAIGVKEGGIVQHLLHKLDIECLPKDIPQHLEIDITELRLGHAIHVKDINFEDITILNSEDTVIVAVTHPKVEKETVPGEEGKEGAAEPEVIGKGKSEDDED